MMEWNPESVLDALNDFERKSEITPILDEYLQRVAKNGEIIFPWSKLKPLLKKKLEVVLDEFYETCPVETSVPVPNFETFNFDNLKKSILQAVDAFTSAPFTIQRLCELVTNPQKHYNRTDKYMRGIEKNVLVVSTVEPRTGGQGDANSANNNVIVNGMMNDSPREECDALNGHESESSDSVTSSNTEPPSNHVLLENFANVFPSAACIPSASNICMKREIDSNFISTSSECGETAEDVEFEAGRPDPSAAEIEKEKEEPMDTSEESSVSSDDCKMSSEEVSESSDVAETESEAEEAPEKKRPKLDDEVIADANEDDDSHNSMDSTDDPITVETENEVQSSETPEEATSVPEDIPVSDPPASEPEEPVQQDDTISQSDSISTDSDAPPEEPDVVSESKPEEPDVVSETVIDDKASEAEETDSKTDLTE